MKRKQAGIPSWWSRGPSKALTQISRPKSFLTRMALPRYVTPAIVGPVAGGLTGYATAEGEDRTSRALQGAGAGLVIGSALSGSGRYFQKKMHPLAQAGFEKAFNNLDKVNRNKAFIEAVEKLWEQGSEVSSETYEMYLFARRQAAIYDSIKITKPEEVISRINSTLGQHYLENDTIAALSSGIYAHHYNKKKREYNKALKKRDRKKKA